MEETWQDRDSYNWKKGHPHSFNETAREKEAHV